MPVADACNPSFLGGWDGKSHGSRPGWANSLGDLMSKIIRTKWTGGMAQVVEYLLCKHKALSSKHQAHIKRVPFVRMVYVFF
jgi:hypothetical protein